MDFCATESVREDWTNPYHVCGSHHPRLQLPTHAVCSPVLASFALGLSYVIVYTLVDKRHEPDNMSLNWGPPKTFKALGSFTVWEELLFLEDPPQDHRVQINPLSWVYGMIITLKVRRRHLFDFGALQAEQLISCRTLILFPALKMQPASRPLHVLRR